MPVSRNSILANATNLAPRPIQTESSPNSRKTEYLASDFAVAFVGNPMALPFRDLSWPMRPPIRIDSCRNWQTLDPTARINFAHTISVDYGIKAADFGDVRGEYLNSLRDSYRAVWDS